MKKLLSLLFLLLTIPGAYADEVYGTVVDSKGAPVEFANVSLWSDDEDRFVKGEITDSVGAFRFFIDKDPSAQYVLKANMIGYRDTAIVYKSSPCVIRMDEESQILGELSVSGRRAPFSQTPTGVLASVAGTPLASLSSAEDVLDHIPGLFKDANGKYGIAGKGEPVFYLNGQRVYNIDEINSLTPSSIKDVEIIRNPGVSYDSDIAAVVKITTLRAKNDSFGLYLRSLALLWRYCGFDEQLNWNYRKGGLDVFGRHSFSASHNHVKYDQTRTLHSDTIWYQETKQDNHLRSRKFSNTLGMNYYFGDNDNAGIKYDIDFPINTLSTDLLNNSIFADDTLYDRISTDNNTKNEAPAQHHINAYYRGTHNSLGLGADIDFIHNKKYTYDTYLEDSENYQDRTFTTDGTVANTMFASKVFAEFKKSAFTLSAGIDYSYTHRKNDFYNKENIIDSQSDDIRETHLAPFVDATYRLGAGQISAGARYERVWTSYISNGEKDHDRDYGNLFPNFSVFVPVGGVSILAGYSIKDRRPSYSMLRNSIGYANRFAYQTGNPHLKSEKIHNAELSIGYKWLQMSLEYEDRRNAIMYSADTYKNSSSISILSFINVPTLKSVTGSLSISPKVGIWSPSLTVSATRQWFTAHTTYGNFKMNRPIFRASLTNIFNFGKGWKADVILRLTSKGDEENFRYTRAPLRVNANLYKYLLDDALSMSVGMSDIFDSLSDDNVLCMRNVSTTQKRWFNTRLVKVILTYNFNSTDNRYKGKNAGAAEQNRL